jgi:hypothetical protein
VGEVVGGGLDGKDRGERGRGLGLLVEVEGWGEGVV